MGLLTYNGKLSLSPYGKLSPWSNPGCVCHPPPAMYIEFPSCLATEREDAPSWCGNFWGGPYASDMDPTSTWPWYVYEELLAETPGEWWGESVWLHIFLRMFPWTTSYSWYLARHMEARDSNGDVGTTFRREVWHLDNGGDTSDCWRTADEDGKVSIPYSGTYRTQDPCFTTSPTCDAASIWPHNSRCPGMHLI